MAGWLKPGVLLVASSTLFGVSCGEVSRKGQATGGEAGARTSGGSSGGIAAQAGGTSGALSTATGGTPHTGGDNVGGAGGAPAQPCSVGEARCNESGMREICSAEGDWTPTEFVCARTVAVNDEIGSYCVTKMDGSYRCWGDNPSGAELPGLERYQRVELAQPGPVGLTEDGRLLAMGIAIPEDLPKAVSFHATNMTGYASVCPLFADGSFALLLHARMGDGNFATELRWMNGTFSRAFCAFEGLAAGVHTDGSLWTLSPTENLPGNDFTDVAYSLGIFCALKQSGAITCFKPSLCAGSSVVSCVGSGLPLFPPGRYRSIAATAAAVCAIDEQGALLCKRYDGAAMPIDSGRYTFAEGGRDVLCALRVDGSTACFRHGGGRFFDDIGAFVPVEPSLAPDW